MEIRLRLNDQAVSEDADLQKFATLFQQMLDRMMFSHFKYGLMRDHYPEFAHAIESGKQRMERYDGSGNTEDLLDAANFLLIECLFPSHAKAHFESQPSSESPGIVYRED